MRRMRNGKLPVSDIAAMTRIWREVHSKVVRRAPGYWERVKANLGPVREFAMKHKVLVGCKNREGMSELPLDASIGELFAGQEEADPLRYWHDTGHAQLK